MLLSPFDYFPHSSVHEVSKLITYTHMGGGATILRVTSHVIAERSEAKNRDLWRTKSSLGNQTLGKIEKRVWEIGWGESVPLGWNAAHFQLAH